MVVKEHTADPEEVNEEAEEAVSIEKAYYDACVSVGVLLDYVETETEKEALANSFCLYIIQALETLGKHLFGEQTII